MSQEIHIRPAIAEDETQWRVLWKEYCDFYQELVPEEVTTHIWSRFLNAESEMRALVAVDNHSALVGFAHYVIQPNTWSLQSLCYLEDLYVKPETRGKDIGHTLILRLVELGKEHQWRKVYWHTKEDNTRARRLYERFGPSDGFVRYNITL